MSIAAAEMTYSTLEGSKSSTHYLTAIKTDSTFRAKALRRISSKGPSSDSKRRICFYRLGSE